jgi:Na+/melibiose symporter-like transporter
MGSASQKVGATAAVWFGMAIICFAVSAYGTESQNDVRWLFVLLTLIASALTLLLWAFPAVAERFLNREKAKRQPDERLALLKELLDEDELAAFKAVLKERMLERITRSDGELPYDVDALVSADRAAQGAHRSRQG